MRIDKSIFRYIEHELYNYDETKKELQRYREEILERHTFSGSECKRIQASDSTESD